MLTSYWVKCPHPGCHWQGSLLPQGKAEAPEGPAPLRTIVSFQCPGCEGTWHARVVGDDVKPVQEAVAVLGSGI